MQNKLHGHLAILGANLIFGINTVIAKLVVGANGLSPLVVSFSRFLGATILFWILSFFLPKDPIRKKDLFPLFIAGCCGIVINQIIFLIGLSKTSPIDTSLISSGVPILTMIFAAIFLKEPITFKKVIGILVGALGALILVLSGSKANGGQSSSFFGDLLVFISAVSYVIYLTLFKSLIDRYRPATLMKWMFLFSTIISIPFCYNDLITTDYTGFSTLFYLKWAYVIVFASFLAYLLIPIAQKNIRPTVISTYSYSQPVITGSLALIIGIDIFTMDKLFAAFLVFLGVYIVTRSKSRKQMRAEQRLKNELEN